VARDSEDAAPSTTRLDRGSSAAGDPVSTQTSLSSARLYSATTAKSSATVSASRVTRGAFDEELYRRAVALVESEGGCSTTALKGQLGVGWAKAAELVERMEREGVVGPGLAGGRRAVVRRAQLEMAKG